MYIFFRKVLSKFLDATGRYGDTVVQTASISHHPYQFVKAVGTRETTSKGWPVWLVYDACEWLFQGRHQNKIKDIERETNPDRKTPICRRTMRCCESNLTNRPKKTRGVTFSSEQWAQMS